MNKQKIKRAGCRLLALQAAAALLFTAAFASIPAKQVKAAEEKIHMDESAYKSLGFELQDEVPSESYIGPGNMVMYPQRELFFDFNGSSNYGSVMRDNLNLYQTIGDNLKMAGAYERYGQYKNNDWANLKENYGYTKGSLGGQELWKNLSSRNTHKNRAYAVSEAFKSASGKEDRVAQLYVRSSKKRSEYEVCLEIIKFSGSGTSCASTVSLGSPAALDQSGKWYNEQFDALFEITAGDYNGDGVDEVAVYYANNEVKIYTTANDRLMLWQTISRSELKANTGKTIKADSEANTGKAMAAVVSLASGDLKKDYTEDLVIGVSMPEVPDVNKYNHAFIYGYDQSRKSLVKDETIDLNSIADGSSKLPMLAVNTAIGDLTGNGRQELVIGGRIGKKVGIIHAEYDFDLKEYQASAAQLMDDVDSRLMEDSLAGPGYRAPIGLSVCNFGKVGESMRRVFLFDRLYSYVDSLFQKEDEKLYYSAGQRNNANEKTDKDAVWIAQTLSGNFTGTKDGSEQLAALVGVKEKGQDKYWYQICFISYRDNTWHTTWEGIINQATSYLNRSDTSRASAYVALSMPDVDDDSMLLKYLGAETYYTKPEIQAVLQSSPYFQDVADTYDNYMNEGSTAYGVSKSTGNSVTAGLELSLGVYTSAEVSFFAQVEFEAGISAATSYEHETSREISTSVEYEVSAGDDYVVMYTIPYHRYWYEYKETDGKTQQMSIEEPMTPSTIVVPLDTYDAMAKIYQGLEPIGGNLLKSVPGEPSTYTSTFQGEKFTHIGEVQRLSNAGGNSSTAVTVSREVSVTNEDNVSVAVEEEMKIGGGAGFLGTGAVAGITQSFSVSAGYVHSKMNGVSYTGTVDNLPAGVSDYGFSWQFGAREAKLNDESVVIIGYQLSNVKEAPRAPKNLTITEIGSREMVLEWDAAAGAAVYELMLITNNGMELPQASIPSTQENADGTITYKVSNLIPGTTYSYTVTAVDAAGVRSLPGAYVIGTTLAETQAGFKITEQPKDREISVGRTAEFSVETENETGNPLNYRWQTYDAAAKTWRYISGEYDRKMFVTGKQELDGTKYRCIVYTGGTMLISSTAVLTIGRSESSTRLDIKNEAGQALGNQSVVQASGYREEKVKVGEQNVPYTVTAQKDGVIYTKLVNDDHSVLWVVSGENGNQYYMDADGSPSDVECETQDLIIFTGNTDSGEELTYSANAVLETDLPESILPEGISKADGYKITENEYIFVFTNADGETKYCDKDGRTVTLYDTKRYVKVGEESFLSTEDYREAVDVRVEDVYETRMVLENGEELTFLTSVRDANDGRAVTDQTPGFQIVNTSTGVSSAAASNKTSEDTYSGKYTFQQPGIYTITAVYGGSSQYTMSRSDSITLIVKGSSTHKQLFISGGSMTYGEIMDLSPVIVDSNGAPETAKDVSYQVKRDGEIISAAAAGIIGNTFIPQSAGVYQITAEDTAQNITVSSEIKVARRTLTITPADVEGGLADSAEARRKKLEDTISDENTNEHGKVMVQGLAGIDRITGYSLSSEALTASQPGEYAISAALDESSQNIKALSKNYTFVLKRGVYRLSQDRVQVTAEAGSNGSIRIRYQMDGGQTVEVSSGTYIPKGAKLTVTAQPSRGFGVEKWVVNGVQQDHTRETYTVDSLEQDIHISAVFSYHYGTLTYSAMQNGSLQGHYAGSGQIVFASGGHLNQNQSVILTAVPDEGYVVDHWTIRKDGQSTEEIIKAEDGTSLYTGTAYTVSNVREDTSVIVYFRTKEKKTVTLRFKDRANGADAFTLGTTLLINGESVRDADRSYVYESFSGDNLTIDITIPDNMLVDSWAAVGSDGTETTAAGNVKQVKIYNLQEDLDYIVYCSIPNTSRITYGSVLDNIHGNGGTLAEAGEITAAGSDASPITRPQGTELTFTAVPKTGYGICKWTVNGTEVTENITSKEDGSQVYRMIVKSDAVVQVHFEKKPVITWTADTAKGSVSAVSGGGSILQEGMAEFGSSVEWTIAPEKGYVVHQVTLNGTDITGLLSADNLQKDNRSYLAEKIYANQNLAVTFRELETYTVRYFVTDLDEDGTGDYGSIRASAGRLGMNVYQEEKAVALKGEITVYEGGEAVLTPVPESERYELKECMINGLVYTPGEDGTICLTTEQLKAYGKTVELTVKFGAARFSKLEYEAAEHGTVHGIYAGEGDYAFASGGQLNQSQSVILTAKPEDGYVVDYWTIRKGSQGSDETILAEDQESIDTRTDYTVSNLSEDSYIKVYFRLKEDAAVTLRFKNFTEDTGVFTQGTAVSVNGKSISDKDRKYEFQSFLGDNLILDIAIPDNMLVDHWALIQEDGTEIQAAGNVDRVKIYNLDQSRNYVVYCTVPNTSKIVYGSVLDNTHGNGGTLAEAGTIAPDGAASLPVYQPQGVELTFTAVPNPGYGIRKWTVNGEEVKEHITVNADGSQKYWMEVKSDANVQVHFEKKPVMTAEGDPQKGSVTAEADGKSISFGSAAEFGADLEWKIVPKKGYEVGRVTLNGADITKELMRGEDQKEAWMYRLGDVQENQNINVEFSALKTYTIRYSVVDLDGDGEGDFGSLEALAQRLGIEAYREEKAEATAGEITAYEGGEVVFTPRPGSGGYRVLECLVNGEAYELHENGTILLSADQLAEFDPEVSLTVKYGVKAPVITFQNPTFQGEEAGTIAAFAAGIEIYSGAAVNGTVRFVATPEEHYEVRHWMVNGREALEDAGNEFVYANTARIDSRVTAVLQGVPLRVTAVSEDTAAGSVDALPEDVRYGDSITLKAEAEPGFVFAGWYLGEEKISDSPEYTLNARQEASYVARFETKQQKDVYALALNCTGKGTIEAAVGGAAVTEAEEGMEITFQAVPQPYWGFAGWKINGDKTEYGETFTLVAGKDFTKDLTLEAVFEPAIYYDVSFGIEGSGGTVEGWADGGPMAVDQTIQKVGGSTLRFCAIPADNNMTAEWLVNGEPVEGNLSNELVIESLTRKTDIRVSFQPYKGYKIPASADGYIIKDVERTPADTALDDEIREGGVLSFTIAPEDENTVFKKLELFGKDCLSLAFGEEYEVQVDGKVFLLTVTEEADHSYRIKIQNVQTEIDGMIQAETAVNIAQAVVEAVGNENFTYNGKELLPEGVMVTLGDTVLTEEDYDIVYSDTKNAGTVTITVTGKGAYAGTAEGTYVIKPCPLTVTADNLGKEYGAAEPELTYQISGLISGDMAKVTVKRQPGEEPGTYEIYVVADAGQNYTLICRNGIFTIRAKDPEESKSITPSMINSLNAGLKMIRKGKTLILKWGKVSVADGYDVFVSECTKKYSKKPAATVTGASKKNAKIRKVSGKKIKDASAYKAVIKPFRIKDGKKIYLASSYTLHQAGKGHKKITNAKRITVKKKKYTLKKGKTAVISVKVTKENSKKALIKHSSALEKGVRFWSSNQKIASVTGKGKIRAVSKGKCTIYVMAENGLKAKLKVTVK